MVYFSIMWIYRKLIFYNQERNPQQDSHHAHPDACASGLQNCEKEMSIVYATESVIFCYGCLSWLRQTPLTWILVWVDIVNWNHRGLFLCAPPPVALLMGPACLSPHSQHWHLPRTCSPFPFMPFGFLLLFSQLTQVRSQHLILGEDQLSPLL